ncbi:fam-c protein [Plasmodium berghei]|uniref:Fam-c protein n=3 Tax=Plasmodium berghei TaxID=5821 RepID=A0A509APN0_PLABA|nr:fam-c protein [Plasmodium berghei ANKA]CXJ06180.1 fam-c protein [Plasmodium berghei]SBW38172.1 fam-c protein [Plasmodium berghei]SCL83364.1 fam-c protein [Plasmodium berghei]SCL83537.1 fam-c protein [Plasmodium berghei]SCL85754.1 fam-c protein [Plasmodium berghei]|eukprot:XP_034423813.1 fam-c protein [Plasmodium berghei ANKA]
MNKWIFSLICIVLYAILDVSIHCSEQKVSGVGSRSIRGIKKMNKSNEKIGTKFKCRTQLKNNNPKNYKDNKISDGYGEMHHIFFCCFFIPKEYD